MKNFENKAKIAKVSRLFRLVLLAALVLWIVGMLSFIVVLTTGIWVRPESPEDLFQKAGLALMMPLLFVVTLYFYRFFKRLEHGHLFDSQTVAFLAWAGRWWAILCLYGILFSFIGSQMFPGLNTTVGRAPHSGLFGALCVMFTAWLFREAQDLQEERELTV